MQEKALQENSLPDKNTPVTIIEPKKKIKEWLSCWTKTDMMETVIMLFLGAGKKKGPLDREQYVHVLHLLPGRIPLFPSLFTQSLCKMFTLTLGTGADRPSDQSGVHLLTVHLPGTRVKTTARKEHYGVKRKTNESVIYNCKTIKTFFLFFF